MISPRVARNTLAVLASTCLTVAQAACDLDHSVFVDAAKRGFTLEFSPSDGEGATVVALAQVRHKTRGVIFPFEAGRSNGYGTFFLTRTDTRKAPQHGDTLWAFARCKP